LSFMKRTYSFLIIALCGLVNTFAQTGSGFTGNGYYRIKNNVTERYIYVTDNRDHYDKSRDKEDFQAIQLWKDIDRAVPNPASVIYIELISGNNDSGTFDLKAQGTGVHSLTGYYVGVKKQRNKTYEVSATAAGVTKFLTDKEHSSRAQGKMGTWTDGETGYRQWVVDKIETNHATNYVGIKPTIQIDGTYYKPFYASFPFRAASANMHIYYIETIKSKKYAMAKEIVGDVPAATPVLIECASASPSENRIELLVSTSATVSGNKLGGTFFCNPDRPQASPDAYTVFNASTMRVFSVVDGELVLTNDGTGRVERVTAIDWSTYEDIDLDCIPANTSYMKADSQTAEILTVVLPGMGVNDIIKDSTPGVEGVYSISGARLRATNDVEGLPAGMYIVGGKKIVIK